MVSFFLEFFSAYRIVTSSNYALELGHKLAEFNILSVNDWYEGVNISAVGRNRAVIGLLEQGVDSPSTRKRKQRTLSSEQDQPTRTRTTIIIP